MNWDIYFMEMALLVASRSRDRSTKVGCIIVGPDNEIRTTGYNGFPRGIDDENESRHERPEKYLWTEHAERNAIYNAARIGTPLKGCRAYLAWFPCMDCARALVQAGIVELIAYKPNLDDPKWGGEFARVSVLLTEANVSVRYMESA